MLNRHCILHAGSYLFRRHYSTGLKADQQCQISGQRLASKHQSVLGLMELERKRQGGGIHTIIFQPPPSDRRLGEVPSASRSTWSSPSQSTWTYKPPKAKLQAYQLLAMSPLSNSIVVAASLFGGAAAINNGLAITPPMGWVRPLSQQNQRTSLIAKEQLECIWMRRVGKSASDHIGTNRDPWAARIRL